MALHYTPKLARQNDNVPDNSHLRSFFALTAWLFGGIIAVYVLLGACVDVIADFTPVAFEAHLGSVFERKFTENPRYLPAEAHLQQILDQLAAHLPEPRQQFKVRIIERPDANALALPGGNIVVFEGLLKQAASENEIAMILGHELGHFLHRDHIRALGRAVLTVFVATIIGAGEEAAGTLLEGLLNSAQLNHSREREFAADSVGLDLVLAVYGHAAGAADFFKRYDLHNSETKFGEFFSTHPLAAARALRLAEIVRERGAIADAALIPFDWKKLHTGK